MRLRCVSSITLFSSSSLFCFHSPASPAAPPTASCCSASRRSRSFVTSTSDADSAFTFSSACVARFRHSFSCEDDDELCEFTRVFSELFSRVSCSSELVKSPICRRKDTTSFAFTSGTGLRLTGTRTSDDSFCSSAWRSAAISFIMSPMSLRFCSSSFAAAWYSRCTLFSSPFIVSLSLRRASASMQALEHFSRVAS